MNVKKLIPVFLSFIFLAGAIVYVSDAEKPIESDNTPAEAAQYEVNLPREMRGVWVTYMTLDVEGESEKEAAFKDTIDTIIVEMQNANLNTMVVQVRPFSDALYPSRYYPWSHILTGTQGEDPGYDPLGYIIEQAHQSDIAVHAWINPFRICSDESKWDDVCDNNPAKQLLSDGDDTAVVHTAGGVYYDPASPAVQQIILSGVRELLEHYPVAGIHIDDYFYPSQDAAIDEAEYKAYQQSGGSDPLDVWRRDTVSAWIREMYTAVKSFGSDKIFSISPAVDLQKNRDTLYADLQHWCTESGYCDWIIPQVYVGFRHETKPFIQAASAWNALPLADSVHLLYGLAAYKCGTDDTYAGSGAQEWKKDTDILSRQITFCRSLPHCSGFVFFSYSAFFGENVSDFAKKELHFVTSVL